MSESELIAEMADIIDMIRQDCLCGFSESCRDCYYNQEAKKIIAKAYAFLGCDDPGQSRRDSDGKKPPQGGSVNTPRPPQDTAAGGTGATPPEHFDIQTKDGLTRIHLATMSKELLKPKKKVCRFVYRGLGKPDPISEDVFSNELPWQPGPAQGGGLPPESATEVLIDWYGKREVVVLYEKDWITNMAFTGPHSGFCGGRHQWQQVHRWLIIK